MAVILRDTELLERGDELEALEAAFAGVAQSGGRFTTRENPARLTGLIEPR